MQLDVVCLGILVADVVARPVDDLPAFGSLRELETIELHGGGCASNTASALVRLGCAAGVVGRVGRDPFGAHLLDLLRVRGVDADGVAVDDAAPTSVSIVLVSAGGERSFLHVPGANARLGQNPPAPELLRRGRWLHAAGAGLLSGLDGRRLAAVLEDARRHGIRTSLDTAGGAAVAGAAIEPLLPHVDVACPSLCEAEAVSGLTGPATIARWFRDRGVREVVLKLGPDGAYAVGDGFEGLVPAPAVHVVDTTGAGDAFAAGLIRARLAGEGLEAAVRLGCAAGAIATTAVGACGALADLGQARALADAMLSATR